MCTISFWLFKDKTRLVCVLYLPYKIDYGFFASQRKIMNPAAFVKKSFHPQSILSHSSTQLPKQVVFWWWILCHNSLVDNYAHNLLLIYSSISLHIKSNFRHQNLQTFHKAFFISIHRINFLIIFLHRQMMLWARYAFMTDLTSLDSIIICC